MNLCAGFIILLTGIIFIIITITDINTMTIPNRIIIALIPVAIVSAFIFSDISLGARIIGFFCISLPMLLFAVFIPGSFGGGDIKLIAVCGFMLGWQNALTAMFIACMLGGAAAMYLLVCKKAGREDHMPLGPFICAGVFSVLYGYVGMP